MPPKRNRTAVSTTNSEDDEVLILKPPKKKANNTTVVSSQEEPTPPPAKKAKVSGKESAPKKKREKVAPEKVVTGASLSKTRGKGKENVPVADQPASNLGNLPRSADPKQVQHIATKICQHITQSRFELEKTAEARKLAEAEKATAIEARKTAEAENETLRLKQQNLEHCLKLLSLGVDPKALESMSGVCFDGVAPSDAARVVEDADETLVADNALGEGDLGGEMNWEAPFIEPAPNYDEGRQVAIGVEPFDDALHPVPAMPEVVDQTPGPISSAGEGLANHIHSPPAAVAPPLQGFPFGSIDDWGTSVWQ